MLSGDLANRGRGPIDAFFYIHLDCEREAGLSIFDRISAITDKSDALQNGCINVHLKTIRRWHIYCFWHGSVCPDCLGVIIEIGC